jgi:amino acid transporter
LSCSGYGGLICNSVILLSVPFNEPRLLGGTGNAASSPWVIAIEKAGLVWLQLLAFDRTPADNVYPSSIKTLPHIINAVILTSAWSAGNTYVFTSSRTLYGLALQGHAPKFFTRISKQGVPWTCVVAVWLVSLLSFLSEFGRGSFVYAI